MLNHACLGSEGRELKRGVWAEHSVGLSNLPSEPNYPSEGANGRTHVPDPQNNQDQRQTWKTNWHPKVSQYVNSTWWMYIWLICCCLQCMFSSKPYVFKVQLLCSTCTPDNRGWIAGREIFINTLKSTRHNKEDWEAHGARRAGRLM